MIKIIIIIICLYVVFYILNNLLHKYEKFSNNNLINRFAKNNITILLTSTVNVQNKNYLFQTNKEERLNTYLKSIKQWLDNTTFNVVLVENTGYQFEELNDYLIKYKGRFQIIYFEENKLNEAKYLKNNNSKGASEIFAINYAFNHSKLLQNSIFIIKITARYFVPELQNYLEDYDLNKYDALRQNDINRCEIVGTHIKNFKKVFDLKILDENGKYNGHVEAVFRYRISLLNNIITCKKFIIEPTQRGGLNQVFTEL